jgi:hypothetical protein
MVTDPSKNIVTTRSPYGVIVSGREEMSITPLPAVVPTPTQESAREVSGEIRTGN